MKTLNILVISGLLALSVNSSVNAAEFEKQTLEMNQVLQSQIDKQVDLSLKSMSKARAQGMVYVTDQKVKSTPS
ncbi:MAG: hypothetical protein ACI9SC_001275 [Gammaproteobacteria bacterium]|jgi:hypothetical protein